MKKRRWEVSYSRRGNRRLIGKVDDIKYGYQIALRIYSAYKKVLPKGGTIYLQKISSGGKKKTIFSAVIK